MYNSLNATSRAEKANAPRNHLIDCINTGKPFRGWLITYIPLRGRAIPSPLTPPPPGTVRGISFRGRKPGLSPALR